MNPPQAASRAQRMTRGELAILGLLVIAGIAGGIFAYRQLADLRLRHETAMVKRSRDIARLRAENDELLQREQERLSAKSSAPTAQVRPSPVESATASRADRMAAVLSWAKIMTRGRTHAIFKRTS